MSTSACMEGMLAAWVFDECDATGQQKTSAALFSGAFRPGSAACGGASNVCVSLAVSSLQTGKAWTAGLNSLLTPPLYGARAAGPALCAAFWDLPPYPPDSSECHRQADWGQHRASPQLYLIKISVCEVLDCIALVLHNNHVLWISIILYMTSVFLRRCPWWSEQQRIQDTFLFPALHFLEIVKLKFVMAFGWSGVAA